MSVKPNIFHLIAFDPGGTVGWAYFTVHFKAFSRPEHRVLRYVKSWDCGEFTGSEHEQLASAIELVHQARWGPMPYVSSVDVVTEDFDLIQTVGGKELVSPIRINAVLDFVCLTRYGLELIYQKRQFRTQITADRLRAFGFEGRWVTSGRGKDAFAAMQHAIARLRQLKANADKRPWKLSDGGVSNARWDCACERGRQCDITHTR